MLSIIYALTIITGAIGEWNYYILGSAIEVDPEGRRVTDGERLDDAARTTTATTASGKPRRPGERDDRRGDCRLYRPVIRLATISGYDPLAPAIRVRDMRGMRRSRRSLAPE
jgi:hypothetical protein